MSIGVTGTIVPLGTFPVVSVANVDGAATTSHAATHATAGADELSPSDIGAATAAQGSLADTALQPSGSGASLTGITASQVGAASTSHASTHVGGADEIATATTSTAGLMSAAQVASLDALKPDQYAVTSTPVTLTEASQSVLAVTLTGLPASSALIGIVGVRLTINTTGTPANCGFVDIAVGVSIVTDGSSVATCTVLGTVSPDASKAASAVSAITGTIAASTGGITVSATRQSGITQKASCKVWIRDLQVLT
jgi:hypothetical protein